MSALRSGFCAGLGHPLDAFQERAFDAIDAGRSVLVAAPTGSGKTLVAEYAIACALDAGAKVFYTTPLKALSNQKFHDFVRSYGAGRVGLLTGDNAINGEAPVVVMTTEVLRNMIYAASPSLDGLRYVVLDEVHYLQNRFRGAVWEEVIIHLPQRVDLVCLSATVSNAEEVADWIGTVRGETTAIIEERRPVELEHLYAVGDRSAERMHLLPTFLPGDPDEAPRPNPEAARLDGRGDRNARPVPAGRRRGRLYTPWRSELVERLADEGMLPVIYFVFSRAGCDAAVEQCVAEGARLTDAGERRDLRAIAERHTAALSSDDLEALEYDTWITGLEAGFAAHHAGMVPPMKEAVEEAFAAGLVKVVFATETLSLGINMPARSVVIEKLTKFTGEHHEFLTPGEYTQLAGRAGRRGLDDLGFVIVPWNPYVSFDQLASLASRRTYALTSSFRPTYNMAANLVRRYSAEQAHHLLNLSFAQYRSDRDVVAMERHGERLRAQLTQRREVIEPVAAQLAAYRDLTARREGLRREAAARRAERIEALRPGDVIHAPRIGRVVVVKQDRGRGEPRVLVITTTRRLLRLKAQDLGPAPRKLAVMELPRPHTPRQPRFINEAAARLAELRVFHDDLDDQPDEFEALEAAIAEHPLAGDPRLPSLLRAAAAVERLEKDLARQQRRVATRSDSLARQFDRVRSVLEAWNYVDGWSLTSAGELLARLATEDDLLVAESLREGVFDGLDAAELAAVVSCASYERRGADGDGPMPPRRWPGKGVAQRARAMERIWRDLNLTERDLRLPESRPPDPGFSAAVHRWISGDDLSAILEDEEMTGGDFVRNIKQCLDLLRQIAEVAPDPQTAEVARAAAAKGLRGVVAASSLVTA